MHVGTVFSQADSGIDADAIRRWALRAEAAGFHHLMAYDHILGATLEKLGPGPFGIFPTPAYTIDHTFHEILTLFSHLAGVTSTIEFVSSVIVVPQRQAPLVAKQIATVDRLSTSSTVWESIRCRADGYPCGWAAVRPSRCCSGWLGWPTPRSGDRRHRRDQGVHGITTPY